LVEEDQREALPLKAHGLARRRVLVSGAAGLVAVALAYRFLPWQANLLVAWATAAGVFVAWVWASILHRDAVETMQLATLEDNSRTLADLMLLGACSGSLAAVVLTLVKARNMTGVFPGVLTTLAVVSVVVSWMVVHTVYTLRYARLYYEEPRGGVNFNEDCDPRYLDFAYLAFTIGMTYQVSDTNLTLGKIRHAALRHALLSFVFGTVILATTINAVASLVR
jgi:uncharacterized membrane protein